jgi:signal transduction histidine kinase
MELARGEEALGDREPVEFSLAETFESVLDVIRPLVGDKDIVLKTALPEGVWRRGFAVAVARVLLNLTTNAIRFTESGFVEMSAVELPDGRLEFSIRDTGYGIDAAAFDAMFAPIRSEGSADRAGLSHPGLGLAICRRLVHAMGGELEFETATNAGTRFYFALELPELDPFDWPAPTNG